MKKVLLAALMAGVASSAMAADLPTRKAPPAPQVYAPPPVFSWTGFYVGVNGGWGGGSSGGDFGSPTRRPRRRHGRLQLSDRPVRRRPRRRLGLGRPEQERRPSLLDAYSNKVDQLVTARARAGYRAGPRAALRDRRLRRRRGQGQRARRRHLFDRLAQRRRDRRRHRIRLHQQHLGQGRVPLRAVREQDVRPRRTKSDLNLSLVRAGLNYKF